MNKFIKKALGLCTAAMILLSCMFISEKPQPVLAQYDVYAGASAAQIQSYLDMAKTSYGEPNTVYFPAGTYYLDSTLYVGSGTIIKADKNARFVKQSGYGALIETYLTGDNGGYGVTSNVQIIGGIWDSQPTMGSSYKGTETFRFIHASNITIKDAVICNVPDGSHLIVFAGCKDVTVDNCELYGYPAGAKEKKEAIQLDIAHSEEICPTNQHGMARWDDLPCDNITIQNCSIHDYSRAIGSHTTVKGIYHTNIKIKNNTITKMSEEAIKLLNYSNSEISGNTIDNARAGIVVYTALKDSGDAFLTALPNAVKSNISDYKITIKDNTIKNIVYKDGVFGDAVRISGDSTYPMTGVTVTGNKITKCGRYGIFATTAPKLSISKNTIASIPEHGILLEVSSTNAKISENEISDVGDSGIALYSDSNCADISGNTIRNYGKNASNDKQFGIMLYKAGGTGKSAMCNITGNIIIGSRKSGVNNHAVRSSTAQYLNISENMIKAADGCGIYLYKTENNVVNGNNIVEPAQRGVYATTDSHNTEISKNTVTRPYDTGVQVNNSNDCAMTDNIVRVSPLKSVTGARASGSSTGTKNSGNITK